MARAAWLVLMALVASCGSTVPLTQQGSVPLAGGADRGDSGLSVPVGDADGDGLESGIESNGLGDDPPAGGGPGSAGDPQAGARAEGEPGGATAPQDSGAPESGSPGTATGGTLKLGLIVPEGDPGRAFGTPTQSEDYPEIARALVADLNDRGGLGGRKVEAVIAESSQDDQSEGAQTRQANEICSSLTQDAKVDLVAADVTTGTYYGLGCYANHRTPILIPGNTLDDFTIRQHHPWVLPPWAHTVTRIAEELPRHLAAKGVLSKKIGVLAFDLPQIRRTVEEVFKPAVERHGGKVIETRYTSVSYQDVGAQTSAAVLGFNSRGVDLVVAGFAFGGGVTGVFMHEAETQGYRPKYGLSTLDAPLILDEVLNAPLAQLANGTGLGNDPSYDISNSQMPPSRNERRCWQAVNKRLGTHYSNRSWGQGSGYAAIQLCELLWLLEAALAPTAGRPFVAAAMGDHIKALGASYVPVALPKARFRPGQADGAAVQRAFRFDQSGCECFTYAGPWIPVGR